MKGILQNIVVSPRTLTAQGSKTFTKQSARLKRQLLVGQRSLQWNPNLKVWRPRWREGSHGNNVKAEWRKSVAFLKVRQ